jgi:hypothetical protein
MLAEYFTLLASATLAVAPLTGSAKPITAQAAASALAVASASLVGKAQCVAFTWLPNDRGSERGGISIPVRLNGTAMSLQLDTGANVTSLYGQFAVRAGWAEKGAENFQARTFTIAGVALDRPKVYVNAEMVEDPVVRGTLGLPALLGKVTVIDYPAKRFCLFAEADLPAPLRKADFVRAMLRNAKLHVPVTSGAFASDTIVFDTGSSEMPLHVDLAEWKVITGRTSTNKAPASIKGMAWGKPFTLAGAPALSPLKLGEVTLGKVDVFTNPEAPTSFSEWPVRTAGVIGNAPFWDGIVIIDLTASVRFSMIR